MGQNSKDKLFDVADRQQGYFTTSQAEECGYHRSHFHRFLNSGEWVKEIRGIYRLSRYPVQDRSELVLWTLWSRNKQGVPQGVWSHETALDIYEITDVMPAKMHMTVPKNFRQNQPIPEVLVLHYDDLFNEEVEERQGYCVTKPVKTLIDVTIDQSVSEDQIELGINQALKQGLIFKCEIQRNEEAHKLLRYIHDNTV
jgi:predicted transcriptional regulator of viral defense system